MWAGASPVSPGADVARGARSPGADVGRGERSPGADMGGASAVPVQMWAGGEPSPRSAQSWRRAGGVGFDINCGVRLIRTNLFEKDIADVSARPP
jgi:hypothetical protein